MGGEGITPLAATPEPHIVAAARTVPRGRGGPHCPATGLARIVEHSNEGG
jgi:hypothetical protein